MAANYQQVIDQTQQFMETFTAMKPQLTAFQPGLVQKIESQSAKIKSTVSEATETTLSGQTRHKLQFLYEESFRVHRQLSKLRSYQYQLEQVVQGTTYLQQFNQNEFNNENYRSPSEKMIQNEIAVLKDLQLQNVRLNAELDQLINQDYHPAVQAVLAEILTAVNDDLQALLSNLNKIYEYVIRSQN